MVYIPLLTKIHKAFRINLFFITKPHIDCYQDLFSIAFISRRLMEKSLVSLILMYRNNEGTVDIPTIFHIISTIRLLRLRYL
jgi:hypothetical protein